MATDVGTMTSFERAEEALIKNLKGYETREQQKVLAEAIENAFVSRRHLLSEAPTGSGKTLSYLIPAIYSGKRVVCSTGTKALQDQIADVDLPFLSEHLDVPFSYAILKGRSNYACVNKMRDVDPGDFGDLAVVLKLAQENYSNPDFIGERGDFPEMTDKEWISIAADSDDCQSYKCNKTGECFAQKARSRAQASNIVVVNHALLFTDLAVKEMTGGFASLIGAYDFLVADEAHDIEQWATSALGSQFREMGIKMMCVEIRNFAHRGLIDIEPEVNRRCDAVIDATEALWAELEVGRIHAKHLGLSPDSEESQQDLWVNLANALVDLSQILIVAPSSIPADEQKRHERLKNRAAVMARRFTEVITASFDDVVRWVEEEKSRRGQDRKVIKTAPIFVAPYLREMLFVDVPSILVSATIAVDESFEYISKRLGVDEYDSLIVDSPFDYPNQAALYVPTHLPEPSYQNRDAWIERAMEEMETLINASQGRALVLFTSVRDMKDAFFTLRRKLPYTCMMQGDAPNKELMARFREDVSSVLFATKSFWTGIDISGEALSNLIISKLPFAVPNDPLNEARCEVIEREGGSPFREFVIPETTILLKQGTGRLIRRVDDRGLCAVLDPRLRTKGYGKVILRSLLDARQVTSLDEAAAFFTEEGS